jgi:hypothetical protein
VPTSSTKPIEHTIGRVDAAARFRGTSRNSAARVHYRSDSASGPLAGESIGIAPLCDRCLLYRERFDGFVRTTIMIRDGAVL